MSLLSPYVGIVARSGPAGKTPIEELYAKLTVSRGGVLRHARDLVSRRCAGCRRSTSRGWTARISCSAGIFSIPGWAAARSSSAARRRGSICRSITQALRDMLGTAVSGALLVVSAALHAVHLAVRPVALFAGLYRVVRWSASRSICSPAPARSRASGLLFLAVAPGVAVCVFFGQNGFYTAALLIGGLMCLDRRPVLAGVLFGILTIKPQLGLLLPVILLLGAALGDDRVGGGDDGARWLRPPRCCSAGSYGSSSGRRSCRSRNGSRCTAKACCWRWYRRCFTADA